MWYSNVSNFFDFRCLRWMDQFTSSFSFFSDLAHLAQADLIYSLYGSTSKSTSDVYAADYEIDLKELELALTNMVE